MLPVNTCPVKIIPQKCFLSIKQDGALFNFFKAYFFTRAGANTAGTTVLVLFRIKSMNFLICKIIVSC